MRGGWTNWPTLHSGWWRRFYSSIRRCTGFLDRCDGSASFARISLGLREPWTEAPLAIGLRKLVGLAPARTVAFEQLFVIKPRHIVLEAEERPRAASPQSTDAGSRLR